MRAFPTLYMRALPTSDMRTLLASDMRTLPTSDAWALPALGDDEDGTTTTTTTTTIQFHCVFRGNARIDDTRAEQVRVSRLPLLSEAWTVLIKKRKARP